MRKRCLCERFCLLDFKHNSFIKMTDKTIKFYVNNESFHVFNIKNLILHNVLIFNLKLSLCLKITKIVHFNHTIILNT